MRRTLLFVASSIAAIVLAVPSSSAHDLPARWQEGHQVGFCGYTNYAYVKAWQAILWTEGYINDQSSIDSTWENLADGATKQYQGAHSLAVDGCAGFYSWQNAQYSSHYNANLNAYLPHMTHLFNSYDPYYEEHWNYRRSNDVRRTKFRKISTNCWVLDNTLNESTGAKTQFDQVITHDGHNHCHL